MEKLIDVTVIIPLYNKASFIRETIHSVLEQDYPAFQIIVVDDCSTDNSVEIAEGINDSRIKIVKNEKNLGTAGNANRCMDLTETHYVIRQDADDLMPKGRISRQISYLKENPEVAIVAGLNRVLEKGYDSKHFLNGEDMKDELIFSNSVSQPTGAMNMKLIRASKVRYWDQGPNVGEDWIFFKLLSERCRIVNLNEVFNYYRLHDENISDVRQKNYQSDIKRVVRYILEHIGLNPTEKNIQAHLLFRKCYEFSDQVECIEEFVNWCSILKTHNQKSTFIHEHYLQRRIDSASRYMFFTVAKNKEAVKIYKKYFRLDYEMKKFVFSMRIKKLFGISRN